MTITFSTAGFYDRAQGAMARLTAQGDTLYTQISTGKRLLSPSDDSVAYQRLQTLARATTDAKTDATNVGLAQSVLAQGDTTLAQITEQLQRASELVVQAGNGTLTTDGKAAIATQLAGILETIVGLVNAKDARGTPLFGGQGDAPAVTRKPDGSLEFANGDAATIPIGDGQSVQATTSARSFLKIGNVNGDGTDIGATITAMVAALQAGEDLPEGAADDLKTISEQTITAQSSVGARATRLDIVAAQFTQAAVDRETTRSGMEDVDVTQAITDLQKTMTVLQATQASFSKLSSLSLFDYLR